MKNTLRQPSAVFLKLAIRKGTLFENAVAELVGCGIDMGTLRFLPGGMSLTVESDGGNIVAALRILANGDGCDRFRCLDSASATLNITEILFEANNGKSVLSISIDSRNENKSDEPNTRDDYCKMKLEVSKEARENALLKLDESEYQPSAGI